MQTNNNIKDQSSQETISSSDSNRIIVCYGNTDSYDVCIDGIYYFLDSIHQTANVTYGEKMYAGSLYIPENITVSGKLYTVTGIDSIGNCEELVSLRIPDTVTFLGEFAFSGCVNLRKFIYSGHLTNIRSYAFVGCRSLPVEDNCRYAGSCLVGTVSTEITSVRIKPGTTYINDYAFNNCKNLVNVEIPDSVTGVGNAFLGCESLPVEDNLIYAGKCLVGTFPSSGNLPTIKNVIIRQGTRFIGCMAFWGGGRGCCKDLESVTIPDSLIQIGSLAFAECTNLTSVNLPNSLASIDGGAFEGCTKLNKLDIPESVTYIGSGAFAKSGLKSVKIPHSVTDIPIGAFENCKELVQVIIPNSVIFIGKRAFSGCSKLEDIVIPYSVKGINHYAFEGCSKLKSISIPNTVTHLGEGIFAHCDSLPTENGLRYVETPLGVYLVGTESKDITDATIKYGTKRIDALAFFRCDRLEKVVIPNSVTEICNAAFARCKSLSLIIIPDSVEHIDEDAFSGCSALQEMHVRWKEPLPIYIQSYPDSERHHHLLGKLYVPKGSKHLYAKADYWQDFEEIIEE